MGLKITDQRGVPINFPPESTYPGSDYIQDLREWKGSLWPGSGITEPSEKEILGGTFKGASGFGSDYRHAGNVALIKNEIANKIATDTGINLLDKSTRKIGDIIGGVTGWGLGLGYELDAPSPIFNKNLTSGLFTKDFLEDMAANYFGAVHGKTGITNTQVVNEIAKALATGDDADLEYLKEKAGSEDYETFRKGFMKKYYAGPQEIDRRRLTREKDWEDFRLSKKEIRNLWDHFNRPFPKAEVIDKPEHLTPPPKKTVTPRHAPHPDRGGYEQSGGSAQDRGPPGGDPGWKGARGGYVDRPLPGRSRYL